MLFYNQWIAKLRTLIADLYQAIEYTGLSITGIFILSSFEVLLQK